MNYFVCGIAPHDDREDPFPQPATGVVLVVAAVDEDVLFPAVAVEVAVDGDLSLLKQPGEVKGPSD